ncbi:MAG: IS5 family transposase [Alphaproteobacteria bacterium]
MNARYASDVTDDEEAWLDRAYLPPARHGGRRRTTDLREVLNAILYLVRTGCQWRLLPKDFPPWSTVYGYFRRWQEGIWHRIWMILLMQARGERDGKEASPTAGVVDSQSVKTTEAGGLRGYDAGKRSNGKKRHLVTDTIGLPLNLAVHAANIQDRDGLALALPLDQAAVSLAACLSPDAGCQGPIAANSAAGARLRLEIVKRPPRAEGFEVIPKRWVIERTFGWLGRNRRLAKDFERLIEHSKAIAVVAIIQLLARRLANP